MSTLNLLLVEPDDHNDLDELVCSGNYVGNDTHIDLQGMKKVRILVEIVKDESFHSYVVEMDESLNVTSKFVDVIRYRE